jgi:hypothetical protein
VRPRELQQERKWTIRTSAASNKILDPHTAPLDHNFRNNTQPQRVVTDVQDVSSTRSTTEGQGQKNLTRPDRYCLIIKYLHKENEFRTSNNIRRHCLPGHHFKGGVIKRDLRELYVHKVVEMERIGPGRFAFKLSEAGKQMAQALLYDRQFAPWKEVLFSGSCNTHQTE